MKNLTKAMLLAVLFVVGQACSDLLDNPKPSTSIAQDVALSDAGAVEAIRANMYNALQSFDYSTTYFLGTDALADNVFNRSGTNRFSGLAENSPQSGLSSYSTSYNLINDANIIIHAIKEGVLDPSTLRQYRGEAYFMRALAMHHLTRALGYEPGMTPNTGEGAGFNLGIIIRTEPVLSPADADFRARSTVSEVYSQITSDLNQAISLLSQGDAGDPTYVTEAAAHALLARVSLYARDYDQANTSAQNALDATGAELASAGDVATMFDETKGINPEGIFVIRVNPDTESQGYNSSLNTYTATVWVAQVPTQDAMDIFESGDARLALFGPCDNNDFDPPSPVPNCRATHPDIADGEEGLEVRKWNGELGNYTDNLPFFRVSEMLLIQAEARLNGAPGDAAAPLNRLRAARNLGPVTPTMENILEERRREFFAEGQRFWDLKRLGMDIRKAPETGQETIPYSNYRVLDNIPFDEVALSKEEAPEGQVLLQNPGY